MNLASDYTIAVDAMGGDNAPDKILEGINLYLKNHNDLKFHLFGDEKLITDKISKFKNFNKSNYMITNSPYIIPDKGSVRDAIRNGKKSSMWMAIDCVKNNNADLIISAGNTGALLVISKLLLKSIDGVNKPAIAGIWPTFKNPCVVLDLGANVEFSEKNYVDFSKIGSSLFKVLYLNNFPSVSLLNIGSEESKGNIKIKNANDILKKSNNDFNYKGYIEGNQIKDGNTDVIVTDGFAGNISLKTAEGTANFITQEIKNIFSKTLYGKICYIFCYFIFKKIKKNLDPRKYNGGIFLGLNSPVIKSHGGSDGLAFFYSIELSAKIIKGDLIKKIKQKIFNE